MVELFNDERIDQFPNGTLKIIQSPTVFSYSLDAVLLSHFARVPKRGTIVDLCAGNGAVGVFLSKKTEAKIIGMEIQPKLADMAMRTIRLNDLENQLTIIEGDLQYAERFIAPDSVDLVVTNPPYFPEKPTSLKNPNPYLAIARHEIKTNLETVIYTSSRLLKMNGRFAMVHRPERFLEIITLMKQYRIMPKRIQFVYPTDEKEANILLIEGIKDGKEQGLKILPPFFVYDTNRNYLPHMKAIFAEL